MEGDWETGMYVCTVSKQPKSHTLFWWLMFAPAFNSL